jgi:hypothetical protein
VTTSWSNVRFDHASVTGSCSSCHNGSTATGKPPTHIASTTTCDDCHLTTSWTSVRVDHNAVTGSCSSCHNGSAATGKPAFHITTTAQCSDCHSTLAWIPASFDHALVTGSCSSCHNGSTATGKPATHFQTTLQCNECHNTNNWTTIRFVHTSGGYPGDHRGNLDCSDCHRTNAQQVSWPNPAYQPDCAACHANDFEADEHKKTDTPRTLYTVSELRDCAGACHTYTDATMTRIKETRNSHHRVNSGSFD